MYTQYTFVYSLLIQSFGKYLFTTWLWTIHHAYQCYKMDSRNRQNNPHELYFLIREIGINQIIIYMNKRKDMEMQYTIVL